MVVRGVCRIERCANAEYGLFCKNNIGRMSDSDSNSGSDSGSDSDKPVRVGTRRDNDSSSGDSSSSNNESSSDGSDSDDDRGKQSSRNRRAKTGAGAGAGAKDEEQDAETDKTQQSSVVKSHECQTCHRPVAVYKCKCGFEFGKCCTECCRKCGCKCLTGSCQEPGCSEWYPPAGQCGCKVRSIESCKVGSECATRKRAWDSDASDAAKAATASSKKGSLQLRKPSSHPPHAIVRKADVGSSNKGGRVAQDQGYVYQTCMFETIQDCEHFVKDMKLAVAQTKSLQAKLADYQGQWWTLHRDLGICPILPPKSISRKLVMALDPSRTEPFEIHQDISDQLADPDAIARGYVDIKIGPEDSKRIFKMLSSSDRVKNHPELRRLPRVLIKEIVLSKVSHKIPFATAPVFLSKTAKSSAWAPSREREWDSVLNGVDTQPVVQLHGGTTTKVSVVIPRYESDKAASVAAATSAASAVAAIAAAMTLDTGRTPQETKTAPGGSGSGSDDDGDDDSADEGSDKGRSGAGKGKAVQSKKSKPESSDEDDNGSDDDVDYSVQARNRRRNKQQQAAAAASTKTNSSASVPSRSPPRERKPEVPKSRPSDEYVIFDHVLHHCTYETALMWGCAKWDVGPQPSPCSDSRFAMLQIGALSSGHAQSMYEYFIAKYLERCTDSMLADSDSGAGAGAKSKVASAASGSYSGLYSFSARSRHAASVSTERGDSKRSTGDDVVESKAAIQVERKVGQKLPSALVTSLKKNIADPKILDRIDSDTQDAFDARKARWTKFMRHLQRNETGAAETKQDAEPSYTLKLDRQVLQDAIKEWMRETDTTVGLAEIDQGLVLRLRFVGDVTSRLRLFATKFAKKSYSPVLFHARLKITYYRCFESVDGGKRPTDRGFNVDSSYL